MKHFFAVVALVSLLGACEKECAPEECTTEECQIEASLKDSLWAYYPVAGNLNDESGNNRQLVLLNGAGLTANNWGETNSAINFGGGDDYGIIASGTTFPSGNLTYAVKFMPRQNHGLFISKVHYDDAKGASANIGMDPFVVGENVRFSASTNQATVCNETPAGGIIAKNPVVLPTNSWYYAVATFNKGAIKLYINGQLAAEATTTFDKINACPTAEFILGNWWKNDNANSYDGKLDEIRIYTRALTEKEIKYLSSTIH